MRVGRRDVTTSQDFPHILDTKTPVVIGTDHWMVQGPYPVRVVNALRKSFVLPTETEYLGPQKLKPLRIHELYNLDERNCIVSADTIRDNWIGRGSRGKAYAKRDHTSSWIGRVFFSDKGDYGKVLHLILRANWLQLPTSYRRQFYRYLPVRRYRHHPPYLDLFPEPTDQHYRCPIVTSMSIKFFQYQ